MKAYMVRTTFLGADSPSEFYFSNQNKAKCYLECRENGEIELVEIDGISELPKEGCTWSDINYFL